MAKKSKGGAPKRPQQQTEAVEQGATLKERLGADILSKLKAQAEQLKAEENDKKELQKKQADEAKKLEQKQKENDFSYLLDNSDSNWSKYK
ncbi:YqkE family protein [Paenibacillus sp. GCM10027627]|uniref:YqkE family protein n=1 Tax=unclassified Paenibacillus TaxID=185978 RepID=UPI00362E93E1